MTEQSTPTPHNGIAVKGCDCGGCFGEPEGVQPEQSIPTPTDKIVTELRVWARAYSTAAPLRYVMSRAADALADSARRERVAAEKTLADINFLWDWRINQGYPFLHFTADAQVMRAILAGERLEDQPELDWVTKARAEESDD